MNDNYNPIIENKYKPIFEMNENHAIGLSDVKIGQSIKAIVNYMVIEKTKSYAILKIQYMHLIDNKRIY